MSSKPPGWGQPLSGSRKRALEAWLRSRCIDLKFRGVHPPVSVGAGGSSASDRFAVSSQVAPFDPEPPEIGDIRLLSPRLTPDADRPFYVAIFRAWQDDWRLVAPFGPYEVPGTPGELLLQRDAPTLRVLCLWNTHSVPPDALGESWFIDRMTEKEMDDTWAVFRHVATGADLGKSLADRVGAPLGGEGDPRIAYQAEEMALMRPLALVAAQTAQERAPGGGRVPSTVRVPWLRKARRASDVALQAAERQLPQDESIFVVRDPPLRIRVALQSDWRTVSFLVLDSEGEPSRLLNKGTITDAKGCAIGTIRGSMAQVPMEELGDDFGILAASGQPLSLQAA